MTCAGPKPDGNMPTPHVKLANLGKRQERALERPACLTTNNLLRGSSVAIADFSASSHAHTVSYAQVARDAIRHFLPADPDLRARCERTLTQLGYAYALVCRLGDLDATGVNEFVCTLLKGGAVDHVDALIEHLDCVAGAWRELAENADLAIERIAAALTRAVLERAATIEAGNA